MNSLTPVQVSTTTIEAGDAAEPATDCAGQMAPKGRARKLAERGMVTAEYAVGILAAVALALVLLKVFHDNAVFTALLHYITGLIGQLSSYIK